LKKIHSWIKINVHLVKNIHVLEKVSFYSSIYFSKFENIIKVLMFAEKCIYHLKKVHVIKQEGKNIKEN
jgi:hypothetical protein